MSRLVLDEQLDLPRILPAVQKWITTECLHDLRPRQRITDDRVPEILLTLRQPTFVTIDHHFWHPSWCHPGYCILYFFLRHNEQGQISEMLRELLRLSESVPARPEWASWLVSA